MKAYYDYGGAVHVHSAYSHDGRRSVRDIIRAAAEVSLDFVMITDHDSLEARKEEGWHGSVLLVVGQEISPRFNHYIAFGLDHVIESKERKRAQEYIDEVRRRGGIGFIAHPDHGGAQMFHVKHFPWVDWSVSGYDGMGVWDFMTDWQSSLTGRGRALLSYLFPALFLTGPRDETLRRWDQLNREGAAVAGIGECDNHDTPYALGGCPVAVFPFPRAFRFVTTHIILDMPFVMDAERDGTALLHALARGHSYAALEYLASPKGFLFTVDDGVTEVPMGGDFYLGGGSARLSVTLPCRGLIRVIRNGVCIARSRDRAYECPLAGDGVYRVEVFLRRWGRDRPWIFANPVRVHTR